MSRRRLNGTRAGGFALASAALYVASFPPLSAPVLAWVALVPLLVALRGSSPGRAAALGAGFGIAAAVGLTPWLAGAVSDYFAVSRVVGGFAALGVYLWCAVFFAAFGAIVSVLGKRGMATPATIAWAWAACEALRIHGPFPAPWGPLAYSQADVPLFVQGADLVGTVGVGALVAAGNAALAGLVLERDARARRAAAATVGVIALAFAYGGWRLGQDFADGEALTAALVQGALPRDRRLDSARDAENLSHYLDLGVDGADLVVWPELALRFEPAKRPGMWQRLAEANEASGADWLIGAPTVRRRALVMERRNAALLLRGGRVVDRHEKVSLVPFGERSVLGWPRRPDPFVPGESLRPVAMRPGAVGVLLCSEAFEPGLAARLAAAGARLLVLPSNDDWFASAAAADHQVAAAVLRAVEVRRPVLRVSSTGGTAFIDAHGRVRARLPHGEPARLSVRVTGSKAATIQGRVVRRVGVAPVLFLALGVVAGGASLVATGRRHHE